MKNFYRLLIVVATITLTYLSVNAQNVGIGTAAPAQKLEIAGTANTIRINGLKSGGNFNTAATSNSNILYVNNATGDVYSLPSGGIGAILYINATGVPTWANTNTIAWTLTGNSGTTAGTNFIGTTDATDLEFKTGVGGVLRMTIGGTALDGGYMAINTGIVNGQQLTVATPSSLASNTAIGIEGINTIPTTVNTSGYGVAGESGSNAGVPVNVSLTGGPVLNLTAGVFGSAARGPAVPTTTGLTSNVGFGVIGMLGSAMPSSAPFLSGAGVLGATKTGGTAPFAAGVAAYSSGGGYGVYSSVTGGGIGYYTAVTGGSNTIVPGAGNFGVYVLGNHSTTSGIFSYMGSKGVATLPTVASGVYATTDSTLGQVWALAANNTKSTTAPTGNGLLVFGTTDEVGTVTLGQNTTTYMTGGVAANGQLVFDNASNAFTATINANPAATASYSLVLPPAQATSAGQVLTNDGAGNLSWATAGTGGGAILSNGTGISAFSYNGSTATTVGIAPTGITAGTYGSDTTVPVYNVNAEGQITSVTTVRISSGALTGTAGGDLTGSYPDPTIANLQGIPVTASGVNAPANGQVLEYNGTDWIPGNPSGSGTVTSVGLALPVSVFNVTGSPVTGVGTLTGTLANQNANLVFAGPTSGAAGAPTFRALVAADLPSLAGNYIQNQGSAAQTANFYITGNASIGTAPVTNQQLTVATPSSTLTNSAIGVEGINSIPTTINTSGYGVVGESGSSAGAPVNVSITNGPQLNVTAGVLGSAARGPAVPTTTGFTSNVGFGVVGLLGSALPSSTPFISGAGVLGATKTGGTAPFAAAVAAYTSGGGYGLFTNVTGGGYGLYDNTTGGGYGIYQSGTGGAFGLYASETGSAALTAVTNSVPLGTGNIGVFVNGNSSSLAGVYSYMGSKGYVTAPTTASAVYAVTDSTTSRVWAITANNTKSTTAPTGNGLLVFGTTDEVGTVTLGQNTTTYMTGGVTANGQLVFDNASNAFTTTINANPAATASYNLVLPPAQATAGQVLTNDGAGNLYWSSAGGGGGAALTNGTGINTLNYNGSTAATVSIANTSVTPGTYGDGTDVAQFTVNQQGQLTFAGTVPITGGVLIGTAGGDLMGSYPNPTIASIQGFPVTASGANAPLTGQVLEYNGTDWVPGSTSGTGTVTSVGLALPASVFNVAGSPVTGVGTLTGSFANQTANTVFAGPASGGAGAPTFRALVAADLPSLAGNYIQNQSAASQTANFWISGPAGIGVATAPTTTQLSVLTSTSGNIGILGNNNVPTTTSTSGYGVVGESGSSTGAPTNVTITSGPVLNITAGVLGSASRGPAVPTTSGFTSNVGFGVVGLLGSALPSSTPFISGAGVLGATKTAGTAPFAAGVAAYASGGGYGVYSSSTGGGIGIYTAVTGKTSTVIPGAGNFGVYVLGNENTSSGVYSRMGTTYGVAPLPTVAASIYATTDSTLKVWALAANNTSSTTAPTGNGLLVFGTTDEVGTVTLGQNTTTYMTGGVTANGQLVFDNAINAFTATINANPSATASYSLVLPPAQGAASTVLTNDGAGNLSWAAAGSGASLTNGTGITAFTYNGSAAATVSLANTAVVAGSYGDANDFTTFTVNAQGQLTSAGTFPLPTSLPPSGAAGGDLTGAYPNPTINDIQGIGVLASGANAPVSGDVLEYNGTNWVPATPAATGVTSVSATGPLSVTNPTTTPNILLSGTAGTILYGTGASSAFTSAGTAGQLLQSNGAGVPTWSSPNAIAWTLTGNSGTTAGTNFIGTTDATDLEFKTGVGGVLRMTIGGTATDGGLVGINILPQTGQQLTVATPNTANTGIAGVNSVTTSTSTSGYGVVGESGTGAGAPYTVSITSGPQLNVTAGVLGSASRGPAVPTTSGFTSNVGFGVIGLLGSAMPSSVPFLSGAGVLGITKTGGTAPFAAGVAAYSSGGGYGVYSSTTGGGIGFYTAVTGGGNTIVPGAGNFGVYVLGNHSTTSGVYSYMGSKGVATLPTVASGVYATTDSTLGQVWALAANNTKSTTAPTGNGLLVFGTTDEVGTVTLGQNTTTYMTGGVAANGQLVFDNASNAFTATINANPAATASYSLVLPPAQATASGQVLTNDGAGNLSWATAGTGGGAILSNGTGISAFSYDGSTAATVGIASTGVTAGTYGSDTTVPVYNVNAQGQITSVTNVRISSGALTGTAGGDLTGSYPDPTIANLQGIPVTASGASAPLTGQVLEYDGTEWVPGSTSGAGTVTSVGLALPASVFNVTGSPVTGVGTLTGAFANQNANTVFAGPSSGAAGAPTFRALVAADLPSLAGNYIQNQNAAVQTGTFLISGTAGIGVAAAPASSQLSVLTFTSGYSGILGNNNVATTTSTSGYGVVGESGTGAGAPTNVSITSGPVLNITAGVLGSASRGPAVPTTSGFTSNVGFGVIGLLGSALPSSTPFISGAGVLGATKTGGTAPFAAGVAAYSSGGGYGVYTNVTGGGYGIYDNTTGGGYGIYQSATGGAFGLYAAETGSAALTSVTNSVPLGTGNIGVFVNGNSSSLAGVYSYMGSKGYVTAPTTASAVYAVTDSTTSRVWAITANNTKSTTAPTGNGLLVFGTTDEVGTVTLGQNTTTYMTGGVTANGQLVFDNASNAFTTTINANSAATASYSLVLPPAQGAASTVLTNDGAGNLSWASAGSGASLTNGTGITAFTYNGSAAATVSLANTAVVAGSYGDANDFTTFTVNAQGQLTSAGTFPLPTSLPPSGAAGGDLTSTYPNPTLNEIQGIGVLASGANAPTTGQVLEYNGTNWVPTTLAATGVTSVSATGPLSVTNPTTTPNILLSGANGGVLYGTGTGVGSAFSATGTSGQLLQSNGAAAPTWVDASSVIATAWNINGNSGTNSSINFIGTTDAQDLVFKADGYEDMRIANSTGYVGIGTSAVNPPTQPLFVTETANNNKYVITGNAIQTSLAIDYQNTAIYGFAAGGDDNFGYAIGVMGIIHPTSHGGTALYGGINTSAPTFTPASNTYYGIYTDASNTNIGVGYAAAFMNGNVGIGTATPAQTLEIGGTAATIRVDGMISGNSFNASSESSNSNVVFANNSTGDLSALQNGTNGQVLTITGGVPTWTAPATNGTVTSVGLSVPASSIFGVNGSPVTGSGTIGITTTGTSGGIPYFSSASAISSSGALTQYGIVLGGGAGGAPTTTAALTDGQVLVGSTGGSPVADTIGPESNSGITVINGSGSITIGTNGVLNDIVTFTTAGSGSYSPSAGTKAIQVELIGGGGGGGSCSEPASNGSAGGGGGSGGYVKVYFTSPLSGSYNLFVGSGGAGAAGSNSGNGSSSPGSSGTSTWFGTSSTYVAGGGSGGNYGSANLPSAGGGGGTASGGTVNMQGSPGSLGFGGSSGSSSGGGGSSVLGGGGTPAYNTTAASTIAGNNGGTNSGAGGSGAANLGSPSGTPKVGAGGNGANGIIIITEYK